MNFYTNITSCILARSRCNAYNPITGELQTFNRGYSSIFGAQGSLSNALQISSTGDLRVISFSQKVGVSNLFCSAQSTLDQAGYGVTTCWILLCRPQHCECIRKKQTRACSNKLYLVPEYFLLHLKSHSEALARFYGAVENFKIDFRESVAETFFITFIIWFRWRLSPHRGSRISIHTFDGRGIWVDCWRQQQQKMLKLNDPSNECLQQLEHISISNLLFCAFYFAAFFSCATARDKYLTKWKLINF